MYLSSIDRPASDATPATDRSRLRGLTMVGGNVFALGTVSLLTDISAEMVTAILPVYLVFGLSMSPLAYGMIDGIYTGATALLRLVGGYVADRVRKPKAVAGIGYAMSALAKLGLLAVGRSAGAIGLVIAVDRAGKGLRTAPRDALITLSAPPQALGRAFGVHRTMDSIGAFLGPIAALAVLAATSQAIDAVLVTSFCIATLGVLIVVLFVRDRHDERLPTAVISPRQALALLRAAPVRRLLIAACLLGFAVIGDGFVYLLLQRRQEMSIGSFPCSRSAPAWPISCWRSPSGRWPTGSAARPSCSAAIQPWSSSTCSCSAPCAAGRLWHWCCCCTASSTRRPTVS